MGTGQGEGQSQLARGLGLLGGTLLATAVAGAAGILATLLLHGIENLFSLLAEGAAWVTPLAMGVAGFCAGCTWCLLRRRPLSSLKTVIEEPEKDFPLGRNTLDAALQVFIVGAGASVGREVAPRQFAVALTRWVTKKLYLTVEDRRVLMASSAGAALGTVYNTPFAGALYALAIMLGAFRPVPLMVALVSSWGAVTIAHLVHGTSSYYAFPQQPITAGTWILLPLVIVVCTLVGWGFRELCARVKNSRVGEKYLPLTIATVMATTGVVALWQPNIVGNGVLILQNGLSGNISLQSFALLIILKPFFTLLTLRAGAVGGVLTPALAIGGAVGGMLAHLTDNTDISPLIMVAAAAALLSVSEKSAWFGSIFTAELIGADLSITLLILLAGFISYYLQIGIEKLITHHAARKSERRQ